MLFIRKENKTNKKSVFFKIFLLIFFIGYNLNLFAASDLILDGSNSWIFHTPDDGRTTLFIAPYINNNWAWQYGTKFLNNGDLIFSGDAQIKNVFLGDVGHGTTWAGFSHASSANTAGYALLQRSDGKYTLINKKSGGGFIGFRVDNSDKMVINDYGNVGIGTTTPTAKLHVSGTYVNFDDTSIKISNTVGKTYALSSGVKMMWESGFSIRDVTTDTIPFYIDPNNNVTVTGILSSQSYACTSDSRFKKNISLYQNALEKILGLRGVTFFWKAEKYKDRNFGREKQIGFIAQEVEKVIPEIVYTDEKGFKTMSYDRLTAVLVEAVKELKAEKDDEITKSNVKIKTLENEIVVVKSENETLKANNAELKQKLAKLDSVLDRLASLEMKIEKQEGHCLAER